MVLKSFARSLPGVLTVSLPIAFLLGVFSIIGVELYSGTLERCACPRDVRVSAVAVVDAWETCGVFGAKQDYREILSALNNATLVATEDYVNPRDIAIANAAQCLGLGLSWANNPQVRLLCPFIEKDGTTSQNLTAPTAPYGSLQNLQHLTAP